MAIAKLSIDIETRMASFEKDMGRIAYLSERSARRIEGSFGAVKSLFGGLAGALSVGALAAGFKVVLADLDQLDEAAERVGVSVESLSALNFAGKLSGVEFEDMTTALTKLSVKMQESASGNKEAVTLFKDLGISVTDTSGKLKTADQVFTEVAEEFSKLEDGAGKTALAVDIFGKSGAKLVPVLNQGAGGLEKMRKEAEALGGIVDGKLAKQAADFNDNMDRLAIVSSAAGRAIAADLLPSLNKLSEEFLAGIQASGGFFAALGAMGTLNPFKTTAENLATVRADLEKIEADRKEYGYVDEARLKRKTAQLEYLKKLQIEEAVAGSKGDYGNEGRGIGTTDPKKPVKRTAAGDDKPPRTGGRGRAAAERDVNFNDYDAQVTQRIAAAIEKTDVVKAATLVRELEKLDQLAAAGLDPVIVKAVRDDLTGTTKAAADELARLNQLLAATPIEKLEAARSDMLLLTKALEEGAISEEKYLEAVIVRLDAMSEKTQEAVGELDEFTKAAAKNIEGALAYFLFDPFSAGLDGLAQKFGQVIQRMIAEAAAAQLAKTLFGDMGKDGKLGGLVGTGLTALTEALGFHEGGIVGSGAHSFTRSVPAGLFAGATRYHNGGLVGDEVPAILQKGEMVLTKDQQRGMNSGMNITQHISVGANADCADVKRAAASGARSVLALQNGARRYD